MTPRRRRPRIVLAGVALVVLGLTGVGCGDGKETSQERALTFEEATMMAELLYGNYSDRGAVFVANTVVVSGGAQLTLEGEVDWVKHEGVANVSTNFAGATLVGVLWSDSMVLERRPALDQVLTGIGYGPEPVIARAPNMNFRIDQLIGVIVGLAATQRDNAQLILQKEGSAFVRNDSLRGRAVKVLRYGNRNIYWVDVETGKMLRLEATSAGAGLPTVIDILERKSVAITPAPSERVVNSSAISEIYSTLGQL